MAFRTRRRVDGNRFLAVVEIPRLNQAGNTEDVVAVKVRDEQVVDSEAGAEAHHLSLCALATVEEQSSPSRLTEDALGRWDDATAPLVITRRAWSSHTLDLPRR